MQQLELYHQMQTPDNVEESPTYQRWLFQREAEMSRACGQAPEADKIRFEDEHVPQDVGQADFDMRCRKCRSAGATHILGPLLTAQANTRKFALFDRSLRRRGFVQVRTLLP